jgi:Uma2 family endonuclease
MSITVAKWTIDQYHQLVNAGILVDRRVELLAGDIVEMSPEGMSHAVYCGDAVDKSFIMVLNSLAAMALMSREFL